MAALPCLNNTDCRRPAADQSLPADSTPQKPAPTANPTPIPQALGGRFRSLMPSNLTAPGALAFESIPARSDQYARPGIKRELTRIFRRDGCHHCGASGPLVALAAWLGGRRALRVFAGRPSESIRLISSSSC